MPEIFWRWILLSVSLYLTALVVPGFRIKSFLSSLWAVIIVGLLNMIVLPVLWFFTLPINILTLGLFTFVLNAIILRIAAGLLKGFDIDGWIAALIGAIVLAFVQSLSFYYLGGGTFVDGTV
jgi:putative membrane protein